MDTFALSDPCGSSEEATVRWGRVTGPDPVLSAIVITAATTRIEFRRRRRGGRSCEARAALELVRRVGRIGGVSIEALPAAASARGAAVVMLASCSK
jgi:hypothetical protein